MDRRLTDLRINLLKKDMINMQTNNIGLNRPATDFRDLLLSCKERVPEKIAFRYRIDRKNFRDVSYSSFAQEVENLGNYLLSQGFYGKHIAISGTNSYEWLLAFFAITTSGNVAVAIDPELGAKELRKHLLQSDSEAIFCSQNKHNQLAAVCDDDGFDIIHFPIEFAPNNTFSSNYREGQRSYADVIIDPDSPAVIFFTSGTSGDSKAAVVSHAGIAAVAHSYMEIFTLPEINLAILPFHHTFGLVAGVIIILFSTNTVFINTQIKFLLNDIKDSSASLICVVPAYLELFQKKIEHSLMLSQSVRKFQIGRRICKIFLAFGIDLRRIIFKKIHSEFGNHYQTFITGGAPIGDATVRFFRDIGFNVFNGYGLTETSPVVAVEYFNATRAISCGKPLSCCTVRIAEDGEIFVKGDNVFLGYYKDEAQTRAVLNNGEFATGDIGHLDEDGFLFITGRKKNLIVLSNGENVSPEGIEMQLLQEEGVEEVVVVEHENRLVALIFPSDGYRGNEEYFRELCDRYNRQVPPMRRIAEIRLRETAFEKNSSRKILRHRIEL
ncbi:MAG: AMP-binding protein [Saccharofermentanales bacterium]|jgi:long-chain acyl-CoA synthetase